jgi:hypothetical protein
MARHYDSLKALTGPLALLALLGGCALPSPYRAPAPPPVSVPGPAPGSVQPAPAPPAAEVPTPAPVVREYRLGAAARSLVTQARDEVTRGDLPAASMTLDRALRIEPTNPLLWIEVGRLRLQANDARQAEGCSRKALALATGDRSAQSQAGHVLADALRAQRRNQEAREVETQPWMN